jgi:hypothetical protein
LHSANDLGDRWRHLQDHSPPWVWVHSPQGSEGGGEIFRDRYDLAVEQGHTLAASELPTVPAAHGADSFCYLLIHLQFIHG